jgi:hypothetical protein
VEVRHHLLQRGEAARHVAQQIELGPVIDADVRIYGPQQHAVDPAIPLVEIVKKAVYCVPPLRGIVEVAVFDHRLRLDKTALRPFEILPLVGFSRQTGAHPLFSAPAFHLFQPVSRVRFLGRARQLLPLRRVFCILRQPNRRG